MDDKAFSAPAGAITSSNCVAVCGMSWSWCLRFAALHGVPVWRIGATKRCIPAQALLEAMQAAAEQHVREHPRSLADEIAALERAQIERYSQRKAR